MINKLAFKKIIILFWTLWWLVTLWTDVIGLFAHYGMLVKLWAVDANLPNLINSLAMYSVPSWLPLFLYIGIVSWSALSVLTFIWASIGLKQPFNVWIKRADVAFIVSISFWLNLFLSDQVIMRFDLEENHMIQGGFQLLSYLALYWLPNESGN